MDAQTLHGVTATMAAGTMAIVFAAAVLRGLTGNFRTVMEPCTF